MTDWKAIRAEWEAGASQHSLATKHGVKQPTISERAKKEHWQREKASPISEPIIPLSEPISDSNLLSIVETLLKKVAGHAEGELEPKDIKLLADALSQFHKIKVLSPLQDAAAYDLRVFLAKCTPEELLLIQPVMDAVAARERANITPIRRFG